MSRSYRNVRAKKNRVYAVADLQRIFSVSANTVSNWVVAGLKPSDVLRPYMFRGAVVIAFHKERRARAASRLRAGEFKCLGCKSAVFPDLKTLKVWRSKTGTIMYFSQCSECGAHVSKIASHADREFFRRARNPNTTEDSRHEGNRGVAGGIGKCAEIEDELFWTANDRIIYKWQIYAGRFDEKTVDRHLAAIRFCEAVSNGKTFSSFTVADVSRVREALKKSLVQGEERKSRSTVAHVASHLKAFFEWLLKQERYKRLPQDLPEYLMLPRSVYAAALARKPKAYPTLTEAADLLKGMPSRTLLDRRARAMVAIAFLGGLRADTLTSLRIGHFEPENKRILQDATVVRAKNGKSLCINWFPIPEVFSREVTNWVNALKAEGFVDQDALFPSDAILKSRKHRGPADRGPLLPMSTKHAVTQSFAIACGKSPIKYTPHSARHTLAAERDARPLTHLQRRAWSEALGHENERITETHYAKLTDAQRAEIFEEMSENKSPQPRFMTDEEKVALVDRLIEKVIGS